MSEAWTITDLSVYPQTDRAVNGVGRIVREYEYWCVAYTVTRPGYVDRDYCTPFANEGAARAHVEKLRQGQVCTPRYPGWSRIPSAAGLGESKP